ncbi:hypothetical protein CVM73_37735 [Bradyrhizobium forestalis]|uniref:Uncharacterized protein n=1 Tax=Bradyrhizobium forestalis TaxID=1419263 RepID=A0A2M8QX92_9BRAD|nr:hypothetical protein [Bradyrhizobium forestalis]PJG50198.1 hypothetical protein CVM73_37735 [Bradyrhizobium forestalis]
MLLEDLISQVAGFDTQSPREKMCLFAWWLHVHGGKELFEPNDIRRCYDKLHLSQINIARNLTRMSERKPPDLLVERGMFKLARAVRIELDKKYGLHPSIQAVSKLLADLPDQVPDLAEKVFLSEAIDCYRVRAYRACIVMTWNLAFDHLLNWILKDPNRLAGFNAAIPVKFQKTPKKASIVIKSYDDFADDLKEFEIIELCKNANLLNDNLIRTLKEKLGKRNTAAHPSTMVIVQPQADDVVSDLVNNVVLALT